MRLTRSFLIVLLGATLFAATPAAADELADGAKAFIQDLAQKAIDTLTATQPDTAEREARFRVLFNQNFDVPAIGQWVLGRYWRQATESERKEYLHEFEAFVVKTYADRLKDYSSERLKVLDSIRRDGNVIVQSVVMRQGSEPPIRIEWRVIHPDQRYLITDVVVEGVSMAQTQRSEFSSVIRRNGGSVQGLIAALKDKNKAFATN